MLLLQQPRSAWQKWPYCYPVTFCCSWPVFWCFYCGGWPRISHPSHNSSTTPSIVQLWRWYFSHIHVHPESRNIEITNPRTRNHIQIRVAAAAHTTAILTEWVFYRSNLACVWRAMDGEEEKQWLIDTGEGKAGVRGGGGDCTDRTLSALAWWAIRERGPSANWHLGLNLNTNMEHVVA